MEKSNILQIVIAVLIITACSSNAAETEQPPQHYLRNNEQPSSSSLHERQHWEAGNEESEEQLLQFGDTCRTGLFASNPCAEGLSCIKLGPWSGRCYPVECLTHAIANFHANFDVDGYIHNVFTIAGESPQTLWDEHQQNNINSTATAFGALSSMLFSKNDEEGSWIYPPKRDSILEKVVSAMKNAPFPHDDLQTSVDACMIAAASASTSSSAATARNASVAGSTVFAGFHIEGTALLDGSFSIFRAFDGSGQGPLSIARPCINYGGGVGINLSALIGVAFTGNSTDLLGCSVTIQEWELAAGLAGGIDFGFMMSNNVVFMDTTIGAGLGVELFGFGYCGNYAV